MKKVMPIGMALVMAVTACQTKQPTDEEAQKNIESATKEQLVTAVADRDQLLVLVTEISQGMDEIKRLENIMTVNDGVQGETPDQRKQIQADIAAIQSALQERRQRLEALEKKLNDSNMANSGLRNTIETLKGQIESQTREIETLKTNLAEAKQRIGELGAQVDSLNTTVTTVTAEKNQAQEESVQLANELNTCYYAIGSKKELKDNKIIETGFLRKTKIMKGDFDQKFFTTADRRTLTRIPLHTKKAKILTNQPEGSYTLQDVNGQQVLSITNPDLFWSLSNYLVIQID